MKKEKRESAPKIVFVKNLPYDASQEDLQTSFSLFGEIKRCFVVKDPKHQGKCKGIGYITFATEESLRKSVKGKVVLRGRKLQCMPAKPRIRPESSGKKSEIGKSIGKEKDSEGGDDDDDDDEADGDNDEDDVKEGSKAMEDDGDGGDEITRSKKYCMKDDADSDDEDEEGNDDEEEDEDEGENEDDEKEVKKRPVSVANEDDANEGRTLFIRNLSFDAVEEDLVEFFEEFGGLNYCRVVINPETEVSRGTAFVKFRRKEDADECLKRFQEDEASFVIEGRRMVVMKALVKREAEGMKGQKRDEELFRRASQKNLHLVKLTMIRTGSKDAAGMSKEDGRKRMKVEEMTKQKLTNPNIFVSDTRICVRNIPATMSDKQLREIFFQAVNDKKVKITECRIMRDLGRVNSEGVGKSKGYAFLQFTSPDHAMAAVLATNNNPAIFSDDKRPIVEFSLENRSVLEMKQKREEKSEIARQSNNNNKRENTNTNKNTTSHGRPNKNQMLVRHSNNKLDNTSPYKRPNKTDMDSRPESRKRPGTSLAGRPNKLPRQDKRKNTKKRPSRRPNKRKK